jgi:Na+-translocating ferredoxin:NAD+ oxidoreductase RNF subunit RnfB
MYENGFVKFSEKIEPKSVDRLDTDIKKSIEKMDTMRSIIINLPGIDCGICGSPTCRAFAEDVVTGTRNSSSCPVKNISKNLK